MTTTDATIKGSTLTLPVKLKSNWKNADVAISGNANVLIVKKYSPRKQRALSDFGRRLRAAGRSISGQEIRRVIRSVRRS